MRKDNVIWKAMAKSATKMKGLKEKTEGFFLHYRKILFTTGSTRHVNFSSKIELDCTTIYS